MPDYERLPLRMLRSRKALLEEGAFTSVPRSAGLLSPRLVGIADGGNEDRRAPILVLSHQIHHPLSGIGSPSHSFLPLEKGLDALPVFLRGGGHGGLR